MQRQAVGKGPGSSRDAEPPKRTVTRGMRRTMARLAGNGPQPVDRVSMIGLGRAKPVKDPAWQAMQARMEARKILRKIKIWKLVAECPEMKLVQQFGSVLTLASLSSQQIAEVPGLGPVRRRKIHDYLTSKNVPLNWEA